ncbi:MAG: response regulator [Geobacter sp.]|nr:MAG: response regulator [Geobacter sp.]
MVEDTPSDAVLIERELSGSGIACQFLRVHTQSGLVVLLSEFCPDVILSDFYFLSFNGLDVLALAREHSPQTPVIMVSAAINAETAVECMKAGAWDYVLKDRITRLRPAISAALEKKHFIDEKNQALEALEKSRNFYLKLFETSPALIWRTDSQGNFDYFNQKWLDFTGHSFDQDIEGGWMTNIHQRIKNKSSLICA